MRILGYRVWTTEVNDIRTKLRSHHANYTWKPGENIATYFGDAWIGLSPSSEHPVIPCTEYDCPCGFWAYDTPEHALNGSQASHKNVLGVVLGYGRVLLGESGWRAEKARIIGIAHGWRTDLAKYAEHYQVPLVAMDKLDWLIEEHGGIAMADVPKDWTIDEVVRPARYEFGGVGTMYAPYIPMHHQAMLAQLLYGSWPPPTSTPAYVTRVDVDWQSSGFVTYRIRCSCGGHTVYAHGTTPIKRGELITIDCSRCFALHSVDIFNLQIGPSAKVSSNAPVSPYSLAQAPAKVVKKQVKTYRNTRILHAAPPVNGPSVVVSVTENANADIDYITDEVQCSCGGTAYHARQKHLPFVSFAGFCVKCHQKFTVTAADLLTKPEAKTGPRTKSTMSINGSPPMPVDNNYTMDWIDDQATNWGKRTGLGKSIKGGI